MQISGVSAIVTGAASGLGAATAEHLARSGARVAVFDRDSELAAAKAREIGGLAFAIDVADEDAVAAAVLAAEEAHGTARILVNCAGLGAPAKVIGRDGAALPLADFARIVTVNLIGSFNVLSKFAERLVQAEPIGEERGVIVNTASVAAFDGQIGQAAYSASKGGIVGMTLPIARELARYGVRVMTIAPGLFRTPPVAALPQAAQASLAQQIPFPPRLGEPDEYAQFVESIICNPMLNGETVRLDGAIRMAPR